MNRNYYLCIVLAFFITTYGYAQHEYLKIADTLYKKSVAFESKNIDSSFIYATKAYNILKPKDTLNTMFCDVLNQYGRLYFRKKKYTAAYTVFNRCFAISQLIGKVDNSFKVKVNMGVCQRQLNNPKKALKEFFEVAEFFEKTETSNINLGITYCNIADSYFMNKQYAFAEQFYEKSEPFFKNHTTLQYQLKGSRLANLNSYDATKAQKFVAKIEATTNFDSVPVFVKGILYNNIAQTMVKLTRFDKALLYTLKALTTKKKAGLKSGIAIQYNNIGDIYLKMKKDTLAIPYLDSALQYAVTNRQKLQILKNLQKAHKNTHNLKQSLAYANTYIKLKDSLNEVVTHKEIAELGLQYNTQQKDRFIHKLQNLSTLYKVLILIILSISVFIVTKIVQNNRKIKQEFEVLQQELNAFKEEKLNSVQPTKNQLINLKSKAVLNSNEILYVKADGHYVEYYLDNKTKPEIDRNSLGDVLKTLPSASFLRIHKSFIVNIYRIKIINSTKIMLDNGVWINLSRTYKQQLKDILHKDD